MGPQVLVRVSIYQVTRFLTHGSFLRLRPRLPIGVVLLPELVQLVLRQRLGQNFASLLRDLVPPLVWCLKGRHNGKMPMLGKNTNQKNDTAISPIRTCVWRGATCVVQCWIPVLKACRRAAQLQMRPAHLPEFEWPVHLHQEERPAQSHKITSPSTWDSLMTKELMARLIACW